MSSTDFAHIKGLRIAGALELAKGIVVLLAGFGLLSVSHSLVYVEDLAVRLLWVLHISPERHISMVFLTAAARVDDLNAVTIAIGAGAYSLVRFIEGYGLWNARVWAEWFAILAGSIYVPLEIYALIRKPTAVRWGLLLLNLGLLLYMIYVRYEGLRHKTWPEPERFEEAD